MLTRSLGVRSPAAPEPATELSVPLAGLETRLLLPVDDRPAVGFQKRCIPTVGLEPLPFSDEGGEDRPGPARAGWERRYRLHRALRQKHAAPARA
jgi:hypothetical protein